MADSPSDLLGQLAALREDFAALGERLARAAGALTDPGAPPSDGLVEELAAARRDFAELRAQVLELAGPLSVPIPGEIESLRDLESLLQAIVAAMEEAEKKAEFEQVRQRALTILDRVLAIVHYPNADFQPLLACQARARGLHQAVADSQWPDMHADARALAEGAHPLSALLTLVEGQENLDDERWALLQDAVAQSFGKSLAIAASRGKLASPVESAPVAATPSVEPREPVTIEVPRSEEVAELVEETREAPATEAEPVPAPPAEPVPVSAAEPVPPAPALDEASQAVEEALTALERRGFAQSLWARDARLWSADPEQQTLIGNRLGWLTSPVFMWEKLAELEEFAEEIRRSRYSHVVLLGMGGAIMAAEMLVRTFGSKMGFPDLLVLDSTDPAAVSAVLNRVNLSHTLFLVASKSGATLETLAFYKFFRSQVEQTLPKAGKQFVAITDTGTPLEKLAKDGGFRSAFLNPPTIGGRYSAISYFGLLPAALLGVNLRALVDRAVAFAASSTDTVPVRENAGVVLGAALGALARLGRDKVTLVLSPKLQALGAWVEQLLAESTGKAGRGLIPVEGEPLGAPAVYGPDRFFVASALEGETEGEAELSALEAAGHPVFRITLNDPLDLGAECFRWEMATAAAGTLLEVNPFDEPNVQEAKDNTAKLLQAYRRSKRLQDWPVDAEEDGIRLLTNQGTRSPSVTAGLAAHLALANPGDYLALLAYLPPGPEVSARLQVLRTQLRDQLKIPTEVGYGPRYLHSTGQLHKGGPGTGLFIQVTCDDKEDLAIPGEPYSFGVLKRAQALGDIQALRDRGRRVVRLHLGGKPVEALERLTELVARAIQRT